MTMRRFVGGAAAIALVALIVIVPLSSLSAGPFTPDDVLSYKRVGEVALSPDGRWIAYTVSVQRAATDEAGGAYSELWLVPAAGGASRPFITGKVAVSGVRFSPDGSRIAFLMSRGGDAKTQVWMIPVSGGEAVPVTSAGSSVSSYRWHPAGDRIAYVAVPSRSKREKDLDAKGYGFIFFEENLRDRNLYVLRVGTGGGEGEPDEITSGCSVWRFEWSPDGGSIAAGISPRNLIDQEYMFQKIWIVDPATKEKRALATGEGKLGGFEWSPDGTRIAYNGANDLKDEAASQVYVIPAAAGGSPKNLTEPRFHGTVNWVGWKDDATVLYRASEGVYTTLSTVPAAGGPRTVVLDARSAGVIFDPPDHTKDFKTLAFGGNAPDVPGEVYTWSPGSKAPKRLTTVNPWLAGRTLGRQSVVRYKARDGLEIEGLLVYPAGYAEGRTCPLVVIVHGGPESNYSNGWITRYSEPAQALAGKGYAVFLPNYRASTGYGLEFELGGYNDPAGKEFDDVADGIDYLAAWFASYYTAKVRAVCMFVGISDVTSKRLTTDIPYEELDVHSGKPIEEMWTLSLERSPIYWAHQSRTAVLILGGAADTRVYPGQSIEFYRILTMHDHPAVRLVQYPGEGHGNARQPGRIDVLYRQLDWYDWYVRDAKPLDGPMPPLDISDRYGLDLEGTNTAR
jgi:dipeptidyl aminopeptidase/acylaminoacyl peptidase